MSVSAQQKRGLCVGLQPSKSSIIDRDTLRDERPASLFQKEGYPHRNGTAQGDAAPQCRSGQITNALTVDFVSAKKRTARLPFERPSLPQLAAG